MKTKFYRAVALIAAFIMLFSCMPAVYAETSVLGDADMNGYVDVSDARLALRFAIDLEKPDFPRLTRADWDRDEKVSVDDARMVLRCAIKLENLYDLAFNCLEDRLGTSDNPKPGEEGWTRQETVPYVVNPYGVQIPLSWIGKYVYDDPVTGLTVTDDLDSIPSTVRHVDYFFPDGSGDSERIQNPNWVFVPSGPNCPVCGKPKSCIIDGQEEDGCAGGGCSRIMGGDAGDTAICPYCLEEVQVHVCHTCKVVVNPHPFNH